jgi:SAM-dependent methyltransferase
MGRPTLLDPTGKGDDPAFEAYEALAPFYDRFTADYAHDAWLDNIEAWALARGLSGRRLLDVACGTGKSFAPFVARGYIVTACDLSERMVARARSRAAPEGRVYVADMRSLPWRCSFDLATCINDAINYLLTAEDLCLALQGIANSLVPGGITVFDANSIRTYRTTFTSSFSVEGADCSFSWRGETSEEMAVGALAHARLDIHTEAGTHSTRHVQRHWPIPQLRRACLRAGFDRVEFRGQAPGGRLEGRPDESQHIKVVCLAVKSSRLRGRGTRLRPSGPLAHAGKRAEPSVPGRG